MRVLTMEMLRQFNDYYDYCLSDEQLKLVYNELACEGVVSEQDVLDEFEFTKEGLICKG